MGKKRQGRKSWPTAEDAAEPKKDKFVAPTAGLGNVYFTTGSTQDAAEYQDTVRKLARHVATTSWKQASVLSKAMTDLKDPTSELPTRPTRKYITEDGAEVDNRVNAKGVLNVAKVDDIDYVETMDKYKSKLCRVETTQENWEENRTKGYNLVLQHCPPELEAELRNQDAWTDIDDKRSVVGLLILIRDLQYNKTNRKRSIMATVEANFELYAGYQKKNQSIDDYYKVFTSTVDTINANGGQAGFHPVVFKKHKETVMARESHTGETLARLPDGRGNKLMKSYTKEAKDKA